MSAPIIFFDIAGPDIKALQAFYAEIFGWVTGQGPTFSPGNRPNLEAALRQDPAETMIYIGVEDIALTLDQIVAAGGTIDAARFEVPGTVILGLFRDPAGNRLGLVEMKGDTPKIP